jgi:hypothetical protein
MGHDLAGGVVAEGLGAGGVHATGRVR